MRWHTKPIMQLVAMFAVMVAIVGLQQTAASYLFSDRTTVSTPLLSAQEGGRVDVQAGLPDPTCPNNAPVQFALTENRTNMAPPRRMRYVDARWEYDSLKTAYFTRHDSEADFQQTDFGLKSENLILRQNDPLDDTEYASDLMSSMFQYSLTRFKNAYVLKYTSAVVHGNDGPEKGSAPALEIPSKPGWPICMPTTGYDIGGGYEAMVVSVEGDRITLHIGTHEYMDGNDASLGGCPLGNNNCRGGYWIYVSGITASPDIADAYAAKSGAQRASDLPREITHRIELPIVAPGKKLGTSNGNSVIVAVRDSGPLIYANKVFMWGGNYPVRDDLLPASVTPSVGPTSPPNNTPVPTGPTIPPSTPRPITPTTPPGTTVSPTPTSPPRTQSFVIPVRVELDHNIDCPGKIRVSVTGLSTVFESTDNVNLRPNKIVPVTLRDVPYGNYPDINIEYVSNGASHTVYGEMDTGTNQTPLVVNGSNNNLSVEPVINKDLGQCAVTFAPPTGGANPQFRVTVANACHSEVCTVVKNFIHDFEQEPDNKYIMLLWTDNNGIGENSDCSDLQVFTNNPVTKSLYFTISNNPRTFPGLPHVQQAFIRLGVEGGVYSQIQITNTPN